MIWVRPVEGGAVHQQNFFLPQQIENKLLVIVQIEFLWIDAWEQVDSPLRLDAADTGNVVEHTPGEVALPAQPSCGQHQIVDALVAAQRGLNGVLGGDVCAQTHRRSEEHTSELQSRENLVCRPLLEKKK